MFAHSSLLQVRLGLKMEKETKLEWHRIICREIRQKNARKYLKKRERLFLYRRNFKHVLGKIQQGQKRYTTEILGQNIQFLESNGDKKLI